MPTQKAHARGPTVQELLTRIEKLEEILVVQRTEILRLSRYQQPLSYPYPYPRPRVTHPRRTPPVLRASAERTS